MVYKTLSGKREERERRGGGVWDEEAFHHEN